MFWQHIIESCDLNGGTPSILLSNRLVNFTPGIPDDLRFPEDFWWMPDGRILYAVPEEQPNNRNSNLWQIIVDSKSDKPRGQARRITNLAGFQMARIYRNGRWQEAGF